MSKKLCRVLSVLLAFVMVLSLVSCGSSSGGSSSKNTASFEAVTIVDDDYITIKVESFEKNSFSFYLENKTESVNLMFAIDNASVNGVMCDTLWATTVGAGLKSYSDVTFSSLSSYGINYIETVELALRVYNSDDWFADDYFDETVTLTVSNTSTDPSTYVVTSDNYQKVVLVDSNGVKVSVIDYDKNYTWGPSFLLYIENNTDKNIMVSADNVGVNGFSCDPYWAKEVYAGKVAYSNMYWFDSTLEECNIESIDTVTMTLRAYDSDNWSSRDIFNTTVQMSSVSTVSNETEQEESVSSEDVEFVSVDMSQLENMVGMTVSSVLEDYSSMGFELYTAEGETPVYYSTYAELFGLKTMLLLYSSSGSIVDGTMTMRSYSSDSYETATNDYLSVREKLIATYGEPDYSNSDVGNMTVSEILETIESGSEVYERWTEDNFAVENTTYIMDGYVYICFGVLSSDLQ